MNLKLLSNLKKEYDLAVKSVDFIDRQVVDKNEQIYALREDVQKLKNKLVELNNDNKSLRILNKDLTTDVKRLESLNQEITTVAMKYKSLATQSAGVPTPGAGVEPAVAPERYPRMRG